LRGAQSCRAKRLTYIDIQHFSQNAMMRIAGLVQFIRMKSRSRSHYRRCRCLRPYRCDCALWSVVCHDVVLCWYVLSQADLLEQSVDTRCLVSSSRRWMRSVIAIVSRPRAWQLLECTELGLIVLDGIPTLELVHRAIVLT
jgi:hypothetical protein